MSQEWKPNDRSHDTLLKYSSNVAYRAPWLDKSYSGHQNKVDLIYESGFVACRPSGSWYSMAHERCCRGCRLGWCRLLRRCLRSY